MQGFDQNGALRIVRQPVSIARDRVVTGQSLAVQVTPGESSRMVDLPIGMPLRLEDVEGETALFESNSQWFRCHIDELIDWSVDSALCPPR